MDAKSVPAEATVVPLLLAVLIYLAAVSRWLHLKGDWIAHGNYQSP